MKSKTSFELSCGGGGVAVGLTQAGYKSLGAIDIDQSAVNIYNLNHSVNAVCLDILKLAAIPKVDLLWVSPPCCSFSGTNSGDAESLGDITLVSKIFTLIDRNRPLGIALESAVAYRKSQSYGYLKNRCIKMGYKIRESFEVASDYGAATSQKRFIARMSRNVIKDLIKSQPTKWVDLIHDEVNNMIPQELTKNQRHEYELKRSISPVVIERCGYKKYPRVIRSSENFPTIRAHVHYNDKGTYRVGYNLVLGDGSSFVVSPKLLSMIQGFPENYHLGNVAASACKAISTSTSPHLAKAIGLSF